MPLIRLRPAVLLALAACGRPAPVTTEHYLTTADSVRLYYRTVGVGDETVIVPLAEFHGIRLDDLARHRRLVLYDPRGRGRSDSRPRSFRPSTAFWAPTGPRRASPSLSAAPNPEV
jgi:pimeloyl-ACP methyl ester carboxylesterase